MGELDFIEGYGNNDWRYCVPFGNFKLSSVGRPMTGVNSSTAAFSWAVKSSGAIVSGLFDRGGECTLVCWCLGSIGSERAV